MIIVILLTLVRELCFSTRWDIKDRTVIKHNDVAFHLLWHLKPADHDSSDTTQSENPTAHFCSTFLLNI